MRTKKVIEKLRIAAWKYANNYKGTIVMPQMQRFEQKFADLVVEECAKVAGSLNHVLQHQAQATADEIRKQLGGNSNE